jgi:hypothetical protein
MASQAVEAKYQPAAPTAPPKKHDPTRTKSSVTHAPTRSASQPPAIIASV